MGCNCNNERNKSNERDFTFNAKITVDKEEFCRAVDRCDDDRRDNFHGRSDR
ncbi:hypothetical protein [Bacillus sp. AFS017336]|uniref:hypothetical protein n=1 Tax=Bacillus sp. AFS017336 TaxID=2033489 RepID=UPI0015CF7BE7|nr:hypothetical protein [Bacillus sp. AFS017336]